MKYLVFFIVGSGLSYPWEAETIPLDSDSGDHILWIRQGTGKGQSLMQVQPTQAALLVERGFGRVLYLILMETTKAEVPC